MFEKFPYLKELGINAIEVMPIAEFFRRFFFGGTILLILLPVKSTYGRTG